MTRFRYQVLMAQIRVMGLVCAVIGHRIETHVSFDIEWDVCTRCHGYLTEFRPHLPFYDRRAAQ